MATRKNTTIKIWPVTILFLLISILTVSHGAFAYNWSWDQNHDCVQGEGGISGWGKWGYDGTMHGEYTTKDCCELYCKACPVYANTGRYQKTFTDLTLPGVGPSLQITRTYNSQEWHSSLLGYSWSFNFGRKLIISRDKNGLKRIGVLIGTGEKNYYREDLDGTLTRITEYGANYELMKSGSNTYTIRYKDGTWYELRSDGKIERIIDKNQNEMVFDYDSVGCLSRITNASGNYVDFTLGVNGKIASISDNLGRTIAYGYDDNGNLISVTDPMGNITQYVYNSYNYLIQIIDARGYTVEAVSYDNHKPPRVATFAEKGETYTIAYFDGRTEKTDSKGNKWTYYYNDLGIIERIVDPLGKETKQQHNKVTSTSMDWKEDANGNRTTYTYDADGNIASKTDPLGNTTSYSYIDDTNLLETITESDGTITKYEYDGSGNKTKIIRDFGGSLENITTYTYDSQGNQTNITDPLGNTTTYEYDTNGNLIRITDPLGNITTFTYDDRGNKTTETDAIGNTTAYSYDVMSRLISATDALGNTTAYTYDSNGNRTSVTDPNGNTRTFVYDTYNRLTQETDALGSTKKYAYDSRDNMISMTDANGNTTAYNYDVLNRLVQETNALGGQTSYTYDAEGNPLSIADANGNTTLFTYDAKNRKISETNAAGESKSYSYDSVGNLTSLTLPNGNVIVYTYDSLNRPVNIADSLGQVKGYSYYLSGNILAETDPTGNAVTFSYDANNRLIQRTDPADNVTGYAYDAVGNMISETDRVGNSVYYSYDALRRRISKTDKLGNITTFSYDSAGNLLSITDAKGNVTSYSYDNANRLINQTFADGTTKHFTYDSARNLIAKTDQNGQLITYVYDPLYRRITIDYPGANDSNYTYDAVGNMLTANNQNSMVSFSYNNTYRLTQEVQNSLSIGYSYNIPNNEKTVTYPGGKTIKVIRNERNYVVSLENSSSQSIVQYAYDNANRILSKNYLNGITASLTYELNGWITSLSYDDASSQIMSYQYGLNNEGKKLYSNKSHDPSDSEQYIYDARYRLVQFKIGTLDGSGKIPTPTTQKTYNLDALSNWVSLFTDGATQNRTGNEMNETTDIDGVPYIYDNNGNLIDDGANTYEYDFENHLIKVTRKSDSVILGMYKYDALGRRVEKQASGTTIHYYYDDNKNIIEERVNGSVEATYVYGDGIDESVLMERGGQSYYYLTDSLGSIVVLTDTSGNIIEQYGYDAYGMPDTGGSAVGNPYRFTGRRYDDESGLYHFRARSYDGNLGRFLQRDPLGYMDSMNLYEYVQSDPVNNVDPYGEITVTRVGSILKQDCGGHRVRWRFALDNPAPCDGYMVQQIDAYSEYRKCEEGNIIQRPVPREKTYWEAWLINKGDVTFSQYGSYGFSDQASAPGKDKHSGVYAQVGDIKFFCASTTGNLGDLNVPGDPGTGFTPGGDPWSGILPSTTTLPSWWNNSSTESGSRWVRTDFDCCCEPFRNDIEANP